MSYNVEFGVPGPQGPPGDGGALGPVGPTGATGPAGTVAPGSASTFLGSFDAFANLVIQYPANQIPGGTFPLAYTIDEGFALWNGIAWSDISADMAVSILSPDGSLAVLGSPGSSFTITVAGAYAGSLNILPGIYTSSSLPLASGNANRYASTSDVGAVYSNGTNWQQLFNPTQATLAISSSSPLTPAAVGTAYSNTITATAGVAPYTALLVSSFGSTNVWSVSSSGVLSGTPTIATTDILSIQFTDSSGAQTQKLFNLTSVGTLTPAATPTFSPVSGSYSGTQTVTISCATGGATIYYTINGATPSTSSPVYSSAITVSSTTTIKAIATAAGHTQSATGSATYTITVSASTGVKWNPTVFAQTVNVNSSISGEASEIGILQASFVQYPALAGLSSYVVSGTANSYGLKPGTAINPANAVVGGYSMWRFWCDIEGNMDDYSSVQTSIIPTFQNLQYAIPGALLAISIGCYQNYGSTFNANAGNGCVPNYILASSATYGNPPIGGNGAGWGLSGYNSSNGTYGFVFAALWNANTMSRWNKAFIGVANQSVPNMTIAGVAYNGFTIGTHPLIELMLDITPDDSSIAGTPVTNTDYNPTTFNNNWYARPAQLEAGLPNIGMALMPGFGFGPNGGVQQIKVAAMNAGRMSMSTTDTKAYNSAALPDLSDGLDAFIGNTFCVMTQGQQNISFTPTIGPFTVGQIVQFQATIGQLVPNTNYYVVAAGSNTFQVSTTSGGSPLTLSNGGSTWTTTGGSLDNRGLMPSAPTLQALDFSHNVSANPSLGLPGYTANTVALAKLIIGFAYNAYRSDHFLISMASSSTYNPNTDWAGSTGFIAQALLAMGGIPSFNRLLPLSYMYQMTGLVSTAKTTTTVSLAWPAIPGITSYFIYRGGVQVGTVSSGTSFTDTGLTTGTLYSYTIAMDNTNGTGPQSAALSVTTN